MGVIRFDKFGGMIPALDERLLPPENATYTENAFLQAGRLEPLAADIDVFTLTQPTTNYAFRVPMHDPGIDNIVDSWWLEFPNADTFVVRSPVTDSADGGRYYWADGHSPPGYTTWQRVSVNSTPPTVGTKPPLVLGIPRPAVAPVVVPSDLVTVPLETRGYVYTWVSGSGEEGQPSPPAVVTGASIATWNITVAAPTTADTTNRDLQKTRIYRTVTGPDGSVGFFFVTELPIATLTFADNISGDIVANSEQLQSENWSAPPVDLKGLVSMPNGMIAGWRANEVWFCEPFRPHAWPVAYMLGVESPIIGLGAIDQNLMVLTSGQPYVAMGIHPSTMALRKVQPLEPCTSPGSIVGTPKGILYTSYNGLILIGPAGGVNLTYDTIRKDEWLRLLNLGTIHATYFMNGYYTYSAPTDGVFQEDAFQVFDDVSTPGVDEEAFQNESFLGTTSGAHISLSDQRLGYMTLTCDNPTRNVMLDLWTGETLVLRDNPGGNPKVFHVDRREYLPRQSYMWRSKIVQLPYKDNYAAGKVFFDEPLGGPEAVPTTLKYYADGFLKMTRTITTSGKLFRLPSGFKADFIQFELAGQKMVYNMQFATSARELRGT